MAQAQTPVIGTEVTIDDDMFAVSIPRGWLKLSCVNGERQEINTATLTPEIMIHAMLHGLKQKLVDAAAISRNPDTGKPASPDDKWAAVMEVYERITGATPSWNKVREGGGGSGGLLFRALCRMYSGKTPDAIREYLDGKTEAEKTALRKNPKVATIIEEIRAEGGKPANVDTDELLSELDD